MKGHVSKYIPFIPEIITTILTSLKVVEFPTCKTLRNLKQKKSSVFKNQKTNYAAEGAFSANSSPLGKSILF